MESLVGKNMGEKETNGVNWALDSTCSLGTAAGLFWIGMRNH